ncbi:EAL domain-containing protein [Neobacillus sp. LXY-1]|uniref:EAL domain-containing protein n=1 Tax=Neobacillus sp. LXY-1 TaxID=3379133 RepID=UPI003EE1AF4B
MITSGRAALIALLLTNFLYFCWTLIFKDIESLRAIGVAVFPIFGGILSGIWLFKAYRKISDKSKYFWMLLCIGSFLIVVSNFVYLFVQVTTGKTDFPLFTSFIWQAGYIFYSIALMYKTKLWSGPFLKNPHLFNIFIFMISATVISIHYLIKPILGAVSQSFLATFLAVALPLTDLTILFITILLFQLSQHHNEKFPIFPLTIGFFIQIIADTIYVFQLSHHTYIPGNVVDVLYLLAIMVIGLVGLYAEDQSSELKWELEKPPEAKESLFPMVSVLFLIILELQSYQWHVNLLSFGLSIIFPIILTRQIFIIKRSETIMSEYQILAYFDQLTGLNNRASFNEDLDQIMEMASENNRIVGFLLIDLDRFKNINDSLGHLFGDQVLKKSAEKLKGTIGERDHIYRLGGDEFIIILPDADRNKCEYEAKTIIRQFSEPFVIGEHEVAITPSIGISLYPEDGNTAEAIHKNADVAMYLAKGRGRNNYKFINEELNQKNSRKIQLENGLRKAIDKKQLEVYYQPIIEMKSRKIKGVEALLRWKHPDLGWISPAEFIPIAEETGQIVMIGEWVLKNACQQNKAWQDAGLSPVYLSVNVSVRQFQHYEFIKTVQNILRDTGLQPEYLELEITESIMQNVKESTEILNELKTMGVKTAIDDFGTGYSSLYILRELPINTLKIDKSFIDVMADSERESLVKTIIDLGVNLNLKVVAEGIEHEHQARILTALNCSYGQGYLFSKPLDSFSFGILLHDMAVKGAQWDHAAG